MNYRSINPYNGHLFAEYESHSLNQAIEMLQAGHEIFHEWRQAALHIRIERILKLAHLLEEKKEELSLIMTDEMGKPITSSRGEIEKCAWLCRYYAKAAPALLENTNVETDATVSYISHQPLGVILAIMPWNFPFWQVFRFAVPNLIAGNTALLKHSENVPGCAGAMTDLFKEAGFPEHVFQNLYLEIKDVPSLIAERNLAAVTLTGSTRAGKSVAENAGRHLKKTVLELGGSDPYLIFADANIAKAAQTCVTSRMINGGQSCIAAKRFIIHESVYDEFIGAVKSQLQSYKMGNPREDTTTLGPMARKDLRNELHKQVMDSIATGAKCTLGGNIPDGDGFFHEPTILEGVKPGIPAYSEELFGPVFSCIKVPTIKEAIRIANDTNYGLGAAIFSDDIEHAEEIARNELQAGSCFINSFVKSDPRLPFGGIKDSGYGRELSVYGLEEFLNIKTVCVYNS